MYTITINQAQAFALMTLLHESINEMLIPSKPITEPEVIFVESLMSIKDKLDAVVAPKIRKLVEEDSNEPKA